MRRDPQRVNPPRDERYLGTGQGKIRGERTGTGMEEDAGTRHGAQGQATEADGRRVRALSSWASIRTRRGGVERVKIERYSKRNGYI